MRLLKLNYKVILRIHYILTLTLALTLSGTAQECTLSFVSWSQVISVLCPVIHSAYLKHLDKHQEKVSHNTTRKNVHIIICLQTHKFWGATPMILWSQSFRFVFLGKLNTPHIFRSNWKWRDTLPLFLCLSNHLQLPWGIWKGVTFHD